MSKISTLHKKWSKEPAYKAAYDSLKAEFQFAEQLIEVRIKSGLSQEELAQKMGTSQSTIARAWRAVPPCPRCAPCPSLQKQRIVNCGFSSNNCRSPRAQRSLHEVDPEFPHLAVRGATLGHRGLPQGGFVFLWRRPWLSRRREAQDQVRPGDRDHPCRALPTSILSSARG
jgi:hypothetical protein